MTTSDAPGKTPQEILKTFLVDILEIIGDEFAPKQESGSPERQRLLGLIIETVPAQDEALHQLHALIRGEVIGEAVSDTLDMFVEGYRIGQNYLIADQHKRLDALFGIEGGPDGGQ